MRTSSSLPDLGFGLGLRPPHYAHIFEHKPAVDWFEIISENFMDTGGRPRRNLARIRADYPVVMHGVALSIGTVDPLNSEYLQKLKALMDWVEPAWVSDHLCWTGVAHRNTHDLLPVPYTEEALAHIVERIRRVQDYLGRRIALENPSTYLEFKSSEIPEAEFIARMAKDADCHLLLDVNNVYVSCYNHRLDAKAYIDALPLDRVIQMHLAGHDNRGTHIIDTHDAAVADPVWDLYKYTIARAGRTPSTMIEWDDAIPPFEVVYAELQKARAAAAAPPGAVPPLSERIGNGGASHTAAPLAREQQRLQHAILQGGDAAPGRWVRDKADFAAADQLAVYINGYRARLREVVGEDYPALRHYLGADAFDALLQAFVEQTPSSHFNIGRYALKLPAFVQDSLPADTIAHDICRLETTLAQVADAAETPPLASADIAHLAPQDLMAAQILPRSALQLMSFDCDASAYYGAVMRGEAPPPPAAAPAYLAVFRHDDVMWRAELDADEYALLQKLFAGHSIGDALSGMDDTAAAQLSAWFSRWVHQHFFTRIITGAVDAVA